MTRPRKQHYVPRFYLQGFVDEVESQRRGNPYLWVCEPGRPPRLSAAKEATAERNFYEYEEFRPGLPDFEQMFSRIESDLAPTFLHIEDPTYELGPDERLSLALFAGFSFFRTPAGRAMLNTTTSPSEG